MAGDISVSIIEEIIFEVITPQANYRIYANGKIEGFGEDAIIINRFPILARAYFLRGHLQQEKLNQVPSGLDTAHRQIVR